MGLADSIDKIQERWERSCATSDLNTDKEQETQTIRKRIKWAHMFVDYEIIIILNWVLSASHQIQELCDSLKMLPLAFFLLQILMHEQF